MSRDTRPYITVANELFRHPKFRRMPIEARLAVLELWAHCNEFMTDGVVDTFTFESNATEVQEQILAVGWAYKADDWYEMHDYLKHQKSKEEILAHKAKKSIGGAFGNHVRHHEKKSIAKPGCHWCANPDVRPSDP